MWVRVVQIMGDGEVFDFSSEWEEKLLESSQQRYYEPT